MVEGGDSLLLMHGLMTPIITDHSANVTVRNLAVVRTKLPSPHGPQPVLPSALAQRCPPTSPRPPPPLVSIVRLALIVAGAPSPTPIHPIQDFPHPSVIEAKVLKVTEVTEASPAEAAPGSILIDIEVHPSASFNLTAGGGIVFGSGEGWALDGARGYRPPNGDLQGYTLCQEYNPTADVTWRRTNPLIGATITRVPGPSPRNVVRLVKEPGWGPLPAVGNGLWFRDGGRQNNGILTQYSAGVAYENVVMHFMSGFCVVTQYTDGIRLHNITIDTAEGSGRHCACNLRVSVLTGHLLGNRALRAWSRCPGGMCGLLRPPPPFPACPGACLFLS